MGLQAHERWLSSKRKGLQPGTIRWDGGSSSRLKPALILSRALHDGSMSVTGLRKSRIADTAHPADAVIDATIKE
jgi:hypothetical protein